MALSKGRAGLIALTGLVIVVLLGGGVFLFLPADATPVLGTLQSDDAGRIRSCGVRVSDAGQPYCASEHAAKDPQAMHRCPRDDSRVVVRYVEANGRESELDICCQCGVVRPRNQTHWNGTLEDIQQARARDPICWRPGTDCPANGRPSCAP